MRVVVSDGGELAIPESLRKQLQIESGDVLELVADGDTLVARPVRPRKEPKLGMTVDEYVETLRGPAE